MPDQLTVQVTSAGTPVLEWHCPRCRRRQPYTSSDAFRANANGKLLDVWLIYRCAGCDSTGNLTVAERVPVTRIDRRLLAAAESNDDAVARRCARDMALIKAGGARVLSGDRWQLTAPSPPLLTRAQATEVVLEMAEPLLLALRKPVAAILGVSGKDLGRLLASGRLRVEGNPSLTALRLWPSARFLVTGDASLIMAPTVWAVSRSVEAKVS